MSNKLILDALNAAEPLVKILEDIIWMQDSGGVASPLFVPIVLDQWANKARPALDNFKAQRENIEQKLEGDPYR